MGSQVPMRKINRIKREFNFDSGINYKSSENIRKEIDRLCPKGVDVYFDNVGGKILDAAMANMNKFGRVINAVLFLCIMKQKCQWAPATKLY